MTVYVVALSKAERDVLLQLVQRELEAGADKLQLLDASEVLENALTADELRALRELKLSS